MAYHYSRFSVIYKFKNEKDGSNNPLFLKLERSLYFINIKSFKDKLIELYGYDPSLLKQSIKKAEDAVVFDKKNIDSHMLSHDSLNANVRLPHVVLDFSAVNYVDTGAMRALLEVSLNGKFYNCQYDKFSYFIL